MKTIAYVDFYNLMFRSAHGAGKMTDVDDKVGMMMHSMLHSMLYMKNKLHVDEIIICADKSSWRKDAYPKYKLNRVTKRLKKSVREQDEDNQILAGAKELFEFLKSRTRLPCVSSDKAEADDIIATMILDHPEHNHIIISTDSDFFQLVSKYVLIFNPTNRSYITIDGYFEEDFSPMIDKKTGVQKTLGSPQWMLFEKCIRGDSSDNIPSSYPNVRKKGSKNKVGLLDAFEDMHTKKYEWFAIMEHEWKDELGNVYKVNDLYERNKGLIDLTRTPEDIKEAIRLEVSSQQEKSTTMNAQAIGFSFSKFCSKWSLYSVHDKANQFVTLIC